MKKIFRELFKNVSIPWRICNWVTLNCSYRRRWCILLCLNFIYFPEQIPQSQESADQKKKKRRNLFSFLFLWILLLLLYDFHGNLSYFYTTILNTPLSCCFCKSVFWMNRLEYWYIFRMWTIIPTTKCYMKRGVLPDNVAVMVHDG